MGQTHSGVSTCDSGLPIYPEPAYNNRVESQHVHNMHLPKFMSPVPEPRALAIDAPSQDWQGRSMYMFPPFPLLSKVIQKFRTTQEGEVILIASWWPSQPWFPHLLRLCVDHPLFFLYCWDLLSQQGYV